MSDWEIMTDPVILTQSEWCWQLTVTAALSGLVMLLIGLLVGYRRGRRGRWLVRGPVRGRRTPYDYVVHQAAQPGPPVDLAAAREQMERRPR